MTRIEKFYHDVPRRNKTNLAKEVARLCGYSVTGVLNWFRGFSVPADSRVLSILSEKTGIPADKLFEWIEEEDS